MALIVAIAFLAFAQIASAQDWAPVLEGPYAKDLKECKSNWPKISEDGPKVSACMEKLVYAIAPRMADPNGIKPIGIDGLDPVIFQHLALANTPVLQGNLTNLKLYNGTRYLNPNQCKIKYDPKERLAIMETEGEYAEGVGDYSLRLNLGALLSAGGTPPADSGTVTTGVVKVKAFNMKQKIKLFMRPTKSGKGLTVAKTDSSIGFNGMDIKFIPSRPDDALGNLLNTMINGESALSLMNELFTPANRKTSLAIGSLFYKGWWVLDQL